MHIEFKEEFFTMSIQVENLEKNMAKLTVLYLHSRGSGKTGSNFR